MGVDIVGTIRTLTVICKYMYGCNVYLLHFVTYAANR